MPQQTAAPTRRNLHFTQLEDIVADAERVAAGEYVTVGQWTFPQILEHLAATNHCAFDGFGFDAPWWARTFIAPFVKNSFLTKTMPPGFKLPESARALHPDPHVTLEEALAHLRASVARLKSGSPSGRHPFLGRLAKQEWESLAMRHAELHLSFVVPADSDSASV